MSREALKDMIDNIPDSNIEPLFRIILRFVGEDDPLEDEIEVLDRPRGELIRFEDIVWE